MDRNWEETAARIRAKRKQRNQRIGAKRRGRVELAKITLPDMGRISVGLEHFQHRELIGLPYCVISEGPYTPGNGCAVLALHYLRSRYAEPQYELEITARWREWLFLVTGMARGLWHAAFHRTSRFPTSPYECERCAGNPIPK